MAKKFIPGLEIVICSALALGGCSVKEELKQQPSFHNYAASTGPATPKTNVPLKSDETAKILEVPGYSLEKFEANYSVVYDYGFKARYPVDNSTNKKIDTISAEYKPNDSHEIFRYFVRDYKIPNMASLNYDQFKYFVEKGWGWKNNKTYVLDGIEVTEAVGIDNFSKNSQKKEVQWVRGNSIHSLTTQESSNFPEDLIKSLINKNIFLQELIKPEQLLH